MTDYNIRVLRYKAIIFLNSFLVYSNMNAKLRLLLPNGELEYTKFPPYFFQNKHVCEMCTIDSGVSYRIVMMTQ